MDDTERAILTTRFEAERNARLRAEAEAERGLRTLYERQRQVDLLRAISSAANEATTIAGALGACSERLAVHLGWPYTCAYALERSGDLVQVPSFSDAFSLEKAERDLAGRALLGRSPVWIEDLTAEDDPVEFRSVPAPKAGPPKLFQLPC